MVDISVNVVEDPTQLTGDDYEVSFHTTAADIEIRMEIGYRQAQ